MHVPRLALLVTLLVATQAWAGPPLGREGDRTRTGSGGSGPVGRLQGEWQGGELDRSRFLPFRGRTPSGGKGFDGEFLSDDRTRWEAAKERLARFFRAYLLADLGGVMQQFSRDFLQDIGIFRNAIQDDFKSEFNIWIDIQLDSFNVSKDTLQIRLTWTRTAQDLSTGTQGAVVRGRALLLMDRHDGFRLKAWMGPAPFGIRDQQLANQTNAGQLATSQGGSNVQTIQASLNLSGSDAVFIDLDTASSRTGSTSALSSSSFAMRPPLGPQDGPQGGGGAAFSGGGGFGAGFSSLFNDGEDIGFRLFDNEGDIVLRTMINSDSKIGACRDLDQVEKIRKVLEENLQNLRLPTLEGASNGVAFQTGTQKFGAGVVTRTDAGGGTHQVTLRYLLGDTVDVGDGDVDCPDLPGR